MSCKVFTMPLCAYPALTSQIHEGRLTKAQYVKSRYNLVFEITPGVQLEQKEQYWEHKRRPMSCALIYYVIYDGVAHYTFVVSLGNNKESLFVLRRKSRIFNPALESGINSTITVTMHKACQITSITQWQIIRCKNIFCDSLPFSFSLRFTEGDFFVLYISRSRPAVKTLWKWGQFFVSVSFEPFLAQIYFSFYLLLHLESNLLPLSRNWGTCFNASLSHLNLEWLQNSL